MEAKRIAAEKAVEQVKPGMIVGLGSGSTAEWAIRKIGELVKEGLNIKAVASSVKTEKLAIEVGIPIIDFKNIDRIDLSIDGADEVDDYGHLIKGGGGALLREKMLAFNSKRFIVIIDESKRVKTLGKFDLPVEIIPFAADITMKRLKETGTSPVLRYSNQKIFITDNGNYIADCNYYPIKDPGALNIQLHQIPGVVESGIFINNMVHSFYIGYENGTVIVFDTTKHGWENDLGWKKD